MNITKDILAGSFVLVWVTFASAQVGDHLQGTLDRAAEEVMRAQSARELPKSRACSCGTAIFGAPEDSCPDTDPEAWKTPVPLTH